jgi:hypothetical protein
MFAGHGRDIAKCYPVAANDLHTRPLRNRERCEQQDGKEKGDDPGHWIYRRLLVVRSISSVVVMTFEFIS